MMNRLPGVLAAASACLLLVTGCDQGNQPQPAAPPVQQAAAPPADASIPLGRLPRTVTPTHYLLDFTIDPSQARFSGHTEIDVTLSEPQRIIFIHGDTLNVSKASATLPDGSSVNATYKQVHKSGVVQLTFERDLPAGKAKLVFDYDAPFGLTLDGLYKVTDGGVDYAFTQFEAIAARLAFPGFDEPGFKAPFDISITAPSADKVVANTMPTGTTPAANGMTKTVFETTKPLPTYLVALAVGPLDIVDGATLPPNKFRDHPLHFRGVTAKGKSSQIAFALSLTPKIVAAYENYFGIGYPFQKLDTLAVPDFAAGAMENAGAITYRERLLLLPPNASIDQKRASLAVQAHEIGHQWFGDLVTLAWWDDTWLNESFADWAEYKASAIVMPQLDFTRDTAHGSLQIMTVDELPSAKRIHQPINSVDDISNAFDRISYDKGAGVLGMFESYLGPDAWQAGIHAYLDRFSYANATAQDFIGTIAHETSHPEIVEAFSEFIDQPNVPLLQMRMQCTKGASVAITQSTYAPLGREPAEHHWKIPMCITPMGGQKICKLMDASSSVEPLGDKCPPALIANADGKGYYRFAFDEQGWASLIANAAKLGAADQMALFLNLHAAMRAGKATPDDYFKALASLAPKATWDLLGEIDGSSPLAMADTLHDLRLNLIADADLPAYRQLVAKLFGPRLTALGLRAKAGEKPTDALARAALVRLMVEEARDAKTMAALAADAKVIVSSGGKNTNGLPLSLVSEALRSALITQPGFGKDVIALFKQTTDENMQRAIIAAASASEDKAFLREFLDMSLTPKMRVGALTYFYQFWPREPVARDTMWAWFKENFDGVVKRASKRGMARTPGIVHTACDETARNDLQSFLGPKVGDLEGLTRPLALSTEEIADCIAFKQAKGAEVTTALHAAAK